MSSVLPAKSTRVGALDSMIMSASQLDSGDFQPSQFDGLVRSPQGMTNATVHRKALTRALGLERRTTLFERRVASAAGAGGAVAGDELRAVLFLLGEGGIGLEAAAAAGFVGAHGADNDQLFAFDEALGVNRGVAAADADGQQLGNFFGDGEEARHGFERAAAIVGVQAGDDDAFAEIGELGANIHYFIAEELRFVDADDFRARRQLFHDFGGIEHVVRGNAEARVRDDFVGGVALVDGRLEDLHSLARDLRAAQATDQLFAFTGKHRADDDFDPAHVAFDDVHGRSFKTSDQFPVPSIQQRTAIFNDLGLYLPCFYRDQSEAPTAAARYIFVL